MATIDLGPHVLTVRFTRAEKIAGLLRDVSVPLGHIQDVTVEGDGLHAARGVRAPGLALPGRRKIGTWRGRSHRAAVSVRSGEPAVRLTLRDSRYSELLIGTPAAEQVARQLMPAGETF